ncbi:putative mao-B [Exophiala viscosa]|uniref:putative mao-B n=1 Tax=Exophiala viscosa TaxID=2486360 RepID=UPI0021A05281|nr:putative mao-B [Exophiala viscosa]
MAPDSKPQASVHTIDPYRLFDSRPVFSHVATSTGPTRIVATAGQVGADEHGKVPKDIDEQIDLAMRNLGRCLEAAGATPADVFKLVYYIVDYDPNNRRHTKHVKAFLNGHRPATTLVPVPALAAPDYKFEIEAYAAVRQEPLRSVEVVVVGGGLSGLKTAYDLQRAGVSCVVVEARDRVGGKTWSVDPTGQGKFVDVGAAWINDTNQSKIYELAKFLKLEMVMQKTDGNIIQEDLGGGLGVFEYGGTPKALAEKDGVESMVFIRELFEKLCQELDIVDPVGTGGQFDKMTLEEWCKKETKSETAFATVTLWTRAMLGLEPREMSALYFLNYCKSGGGLLQMRSDFKHGGQHLRFIRGTQSMSIELAKLLTPGTVILNSPVRHISQSPEGIYVSAGRGDFKCQRVVVSVPTPLYKDITFDPPLPEAKVEIGQNNVLGYTLKVLVLYKEPWWRKAGLVGAVMSFVGPITTCRDTSNDEKGEYSLTCFTNGDFGRKMSLLPQQERHNNILAHIKRMFGKYADVQDPIAITEHEWSKDQWAQGCPCPASPPGIMTKYDKELRTTHGKVHFVGTETAYEWKGYMDGAVRSGERGAKEIIAALGRAKL